MSVELTIETVEETIVLELQDHVPAVLTIDHIPELRDELDSKVDKEAGKSLVPDTEIDKLSTVEEYATANRPDAQNADKVHEHVIADVTGLDDALADKVDKEAGMGLSELSFTAVDKLSLDQSEQDRHTHNNKTVIDALSDDAGVLQYKGLPISDQAALDAKVDKVAGKSLVSDTEIAKLVTVQENATENRDDALNADKIHDHVIADITGLDAALLTKFDKADIAQATGTATDKVMSQKAVTDAIASSGAVLKPIYSSATVNEFDEGSVLVGYELRANMDAPTPQPASIVSALIPVRGWNYLTVQGLPVPSPYDRQYAFMGRDGQTIVHRGFFGVATSGATITVPSGAFFFIFSVSQRNGTDQDNSAIQVESGAIASDYVAYKKDSIVGIGSRLLAEPEQVHLSYKGVKNLFDKSSVVNGFEVYHDGRILAQPDSTYVSIDIRDVDSAHLTISGLPTYSDGLSARRYAFYSSDSISADTAVSTGGINRTDDTATIAIPEGADWLALCIIQRSASPVDYGTIQIEAGADSTPYAPYQPVITRINDIPLDAGREADSDSYSGGVGFGFGDSITETTKVDSGDYLFPTGFRGNWPDFAIPKIRPDAYYSFAKSGASFASKSETSGFQHFAHQITAAADYAELNSINPRWLIVCLGTNDGVGLNQDFDMVMGKELSFDPDGTPITTLDSTKSLEAARLGFARLRWHFPQTVMFCALPLQNTRPSNARGDQIAWFELLTRVARCYGFEVIDCFGESGIVREFEVAGGEGRDLYDGLHTNLSGRKKQGGLIASKIITRLS